MTAHSPHLDASTREPPDGTGRAARRHLHLTVLGHWHVGLIGARVRVRSHPGGFPLSRTTPHFAPHGVPLGDPFISRTPLRIEPLGALGARVDRAGARTPASVDGAPLRGPVTLDHARLEQGVVLTLGDRVALLLHLRADVDHDDDDHGFVGQAPAMIEVRRRLRLIADLDVPVLIRGPSGAGKELVAHAIHDASARRERPWVSVNMAAIPTALAASVLFGHVKGAFTGATTDQPGHFERAHGGTLFMDEIGDTPAEVQVMLLRSLATGELSVVGGRWLVWVDVWVIAATDADLERGVETGGFRAPLLYRLSGFQLWIPPLSARREDIGRLVAHFARQELRAIGREADLDRADPDAHYLPAALCAALTRAHLPGNVRQLHNIVRQLVILHREGRRIEQWADLVPPPAEGRAPADAPAALPPVARRLAEDIAPEEVQAALETHRYRIAGAAQALGISRGALYRLVEASGGLRKGSDLTPDQISAALATHPGQLAAAAQALRVSKVALTRRMTALGLKHPAR